MRITNERRAKAERFFRQADAIRSVCGELLISRIARERYGLSGERLVFAHGAYGKPYIPGFAYHYNVSHSGSYVVCAVSNYTVGVDVEQIRPIDLSIAERYFAPAEMEDLRCSQPHDRLDKFYELWTLKESYIKMVGKGLSMPLHSFVVRQEGSGYTIDQLQSEAHGTKTVPYEDVTYKPCPYPTHQAYGQVVPLQADYKLAVCSPYPFKNPTLNIIPFSSFLS